MRRSMVLSMAALAMLAIVAAACGSGGSGSGSSSEPGVARSATSEGAAVALPAGEDLYEPPDELLDGDAGTLVWFDEQPSIGDARAWRTLARTSVRGGKPGWVTGSVYRPIGDAPAGGFPQVVWIHGTAGLADQCAPSRAQAAVPGIAELLRAGFVVVAPDGAGLGPPGPAHYLVGESEGHAVLDAARAATQVPGADAGTDVALWGFSSGGHAALFAAEQVADYAPDLSLLGTAAVAPVSDVARFAGRSAAFPLTYGYAFLTFGAWSEVYGADPASIFAPGVIDDLPVLESECSTTIAPRFALTPIAELSAADPLTTPPWPELMAENEAGQMAVTGPLLLVQGADDPIIAPESTEALARRQCQLGTDVELRLVPDQRHDVILAEADAIVRWLADRAAGAPTRPTCAGP